jgi:ribose-phosphate pyrophosphokinase
VFIIQSIAGQNINDLLMELLVAADAAKRASVGTLTAVIPHYAYARQDRKSDSREPITARLVANLLETAGFDRVITLDLHADQIQGFFDIPVDHLYGSSILADYIQSLNLENLIIASPDVGGSKRAANFCKKLERRLKHEVPMVICYKQRLKANQISEMRVLGDVEGKDVVIVDDIADTAGTLCKAAAVMKECGAKTVRAVVTHGIMSGNACEKVMNSQLENLIFSDSLPFDTEKCPKVQVITMQRAFSETINAIQTHTSISDRNLR